MFIWPHGLAIDPDGNVWVTDAVAANRTPNGDKRGQQVVKFSPDGKVLMRLGTPGVAGGGPDHFNSPSDVVVAPNGDIFVADGHNENGNNRVVKFSKDGKYIKEWGKTGYAPGEFRTLHAIAMDSRGRIFVGDRSNNRDAALRPGREVPRPSGRSSAGRAASPSTAEDRIYVADSESDDVQNPGWEMGIRIGDARDRVGHRVHSVPVGRSARNGGERRRVRGGRPRRQIYGGEPRPKQLRKYVRVQTLTVC